MKTLFRGILVVSAMAILTPAQAADLPETVNCAAHQCRGKPMLQYSAQLGASCLTIWKKLNFTSMQQMISINKNITGLNCGKALRQGQIICYPQTKSDAGC